jgi:hypothetical protein
VLLLFEEAEPAPGDFGGLHYFAEGLATVFLTAGFLEIGFLAAGFFEAAFAAGAFLAATFEELYGRFSSLSRSLKPVVKDSPIARARLAASSKAALASGFSRNCFATASPAAIPVVNQNNFFMITSSFP